MSAVEPLFPEYPIKAKRGARGKPRGCCEAAADEGRLLATLHHLAHSRTAFTTAQLAELAGVSMMQAEFECKRAVDKKWLYHCVPEKAGGPPLEGRGRMYRGRLK